MQLMLFLKSEDSRFTAKTYELSGWTLAVKFTLTSTSSTISSPHGMRQTDMLKKYDAEKDHFNPTW